MPEPSENLNENQFAELQARFARQLRDRQVRSVHEFIGRLDFSLNLEHLARLVGIDMDYRRSNGETAPLNGYFEDFPQLADIEQKQTITRALHDSTAVFTELFTDAPLEKTRQVINPGDTIDDFDLLAELGRGSFATVFLARQVSMQRLVALKVSADHGLEAQTLAQLDHPNIVRVYDQRRARDFDLQLLYMQYLEGGTLLDTVNRVFQNELSEVNGRTLVESIDQAVADRGASPHHESPTRKFFLASNWDQAVCRIGYYLGQALGYAHRKGVLHRDIKPANVLIGSDCGMKLADFNISSAEHVMGESRFGGSLAYMSPEQIRAFNRDDPFRSDQLDGRSDIYSLGVMLLHLLKGHLPFSSFSGSRSGSGLEEMVREREHAADRIDGLLKGHSALLKSALSKCLAANKDDRHGSADELARQLKIGLDPEAEGILYPPLGSWTTWFRRHFYVVCILIAVILNGLAALFVFNFNLLDAVPQEGRRRFTMAVLVINSLLFPLAAISFVWLTLPVFRACRTDRTGLRSSVSDLQQAIFRTLSSGHYQATICGSLWLLAGVVFPLVLTAMGVDLQRSDWVNFLASHVLSGIAITTLTFLALAFLSLRIWFPYLIQQSFSSEVVETTQLGLRRLIQRIPIYQVLAVSIPLLAMALLVVFGDEMARSKFALTVISLFGLLTVPLIMMGGNKIRAVCERLLSVLSD